MRRWTSRAPASFSIATIWRVVLPRTIESSTTTTRLPATISGKGVELHPQPVLAQLLPGLDERARHVAVLDQAVVLGQAGGEPVRAGFARVRDGDHEVGLDQASRQRISPISRVRSAAPGSPAASRVARSRCARTRTSPCGALDHRLHRQPVSGQSDHLAGLDLTDQLGADDVEAQLSEATTKHSGSRRSASSCRAPAGAPRAGRGTRPPRAWSSRRSRRHPPAAASPRRPRPRCSRRCGARAAPR